MNLKFKPHPFTSSLLVLLVLTATACSGGSSGGGGNPPPRAPVNTELTGSVASATSAVTITVFRIDPQSRALDPIETLATTNAGEFSTTLPGAGPFLLLATDGTLADPATGQSVSLASNLPSSLDDPRPRTLAAIFGGGLPGAFPLEISPLTSIAAQRIGELSKTNPSALSELQVALIHQQLGGEFGLGTILLGTDLRSLKPISFTDPNNAALITGKLTGEDVFLGAILAALSQRALDLALPHPLDLIDALGRDFADGQFNGAAPLLNGQSEEILLNNGVLSRNEGLSLLSAALTKFLDTNPLNLSTTNSGNFNATLISFISQNNIRDTLLNINRAPLFDPLANLSILEDSGAFIVNISNITAGSPNEDAPPNSGTPQSVNFTVQSSDPGLIPNPTITGSGASRQLNVNPAPNASGAVMMTVIAQDDGGLSNGAFDTFIRRFMIVVNEVNDAPQFDVIPDLTILEDVVETVTLVNLNPGPSESSQALNLTATSSNPTLIPNPVINGSVLTLTPSPNSNGTATITVTVTDDGGTLNGGVDSFQRSFQVTVTPVNDAPSFDILGNQSVLEDSAATTVTVQNLLAGPSDESGQSIALTAVSSDPSIIPNPSVNGLMLSFAPAPDANGVVTITVTATDDGGVMNGGVNDFQRSFSVTVDPVNDAPSITQPGDVFGALNTAGTVNLQGVSPGGGVDETNQTLTLTVSSNDPSFFTALSAGPVNNQSAILNYTPALNRSGTVQITVTVDDGQSTNNQASVSFFLTINGLLGVTESQLAAVNTVTGQASRISGYGLSGLRNGDGAAFDPNSNSFYVVDVTVDQLFKIDAVTAIALPLGNPLGFANVRGLAFDPNNNILYGSDDSSNQLVQINVSTGEATAIGPLNFNAVDGLAYDSTNNILYGSDTSTDQLITINVTTGAGTAVGPFGGNFSQVRGLAFDANTGTLYGSNSSTDELVTIDVTTGLASAVGSVGFGNVKGLAFDVNGNKLYGVDVTTDQVISINTTNGAGTLIGGLSFLQVQGSAFDSARQILYGVDPNRDVIVQIDPITGVGRTFIGSAGTLADQGFNDIRALAFDSTNNRLVAVDFASDQFLAIDTNTGAATMIGAVSGTDIEALAFDPVGGLLYGIDNGTDNLVNIDLSNGTPTIVGNLAGQGFTDIRALAFDGAGSRLFAMDFSQSPRRLVSINPVNAMGTVIGPMTESGLEGLSFDNTNNVLYGTNRLDPRLVIRINTQTAQSIRIGQTGFSQLRACAFDSLNSRSFVTDTGAELLLSIDAGNGQTTIIGALGRKIEGLAFDSTANGGQGLLYGSDGANLLTIDVNTAAVTVIGSFGLTGVKGMAYDSVASLLYVTDTVTDSLYTVNVGSGATTLIGSLGSLGLGEVEGLAFDGSQLYGSDSATRQLIVIDRSTGLGSIVGSTGTVALRGLTFGR